MKRFPSVKPCIGRLLFLVVLLTVTSVHADHVAVEITGVGDGLQKKLRQNITLTRQNELKKLTTARTKALIDRAKKEIRASLESRGYYRPHIEAKLNGMEENKEHWQATFHIDPGPRVRITELSLAIEGEGKDDRELRAAFDKFPLQEGDALDHDRYEAGKKQIDNLATERGYFDAAWQSHVIRVDVGDDSARIDLKYDTGQRHRFGHIDLPETVVSKTVLQQMMPFETGDPYNAKHLIDLTQTLRNSNYFDDVRVTPELKERRDGKVPVTVSISPRSRNSYTVGGGFGTDTGPRLVGSWDNRYFNRRGHRIETDLRLSPVLSSLTGSYLIPYFRNRDAELRFSSSLSHEDTDSRQNDTFQLGTQHLRKRWGWNETLGLTYQFESFELADTSEDTQLLIPRIGYSNSVTDNAIYTSNGYRIGLELRGAAEGFISDLSFLQATLRGKYIRSPWRDGRIITRAEVGGTVTSSFTELPASIRFFAGGDNSVRGFDFEALGPTDANGEVVGGRYLLTGSLEYEHRLRERWSAAVFTDFGNAFNDPDDYDLEYSVGIGARWLSPVGQVRLDLAAGISRDDIPIRLHIIVGPDL